MTRDMRLREIAGNRLMMQRNYEPKLRKLVHIRSAKFGFSEDERKVALRSIDALVWKLTAAGIHLERLWENRETFDIQQLMARLLEKEPDPRRFTDPEIAFLTAEFEAFLFQSRAFIAVAQVHTLDACRVNFGGMLTNEKYKKKVWNSPPETKEQLVKAYTYFTENVFGTGNWGTLLKSLRDRIAHFDRVKPSVSVEENGAETIGVAGRTFEQLAQEFENGIYDLMVNVIAPIWGCKWEAGSYHIGMWE